MLSLFIMTVCHACFLPVVTGTIWSEATPCPVILCLFSLSWAIFVILCPVLLPLLFLIHFPERRYLYCLLQLFLVKFLLGFPLLGVLLASPFTSPSAVSISLTCPISAHVGPISLISSSSPPSLPLPFSDFLLRFCPTTTISSSPYSVLPCYSPDILLSSSLSLGDDHRVSG